jgi:hypothetical protein
MVILWSAKIGTVGRCGIALALQSTIRVSADSGILNEAGQQGFDGVLAVIAEPRALVGGVMLVREKRLGVDRVYPCAGIVVRVWRVSDRKQIGFTAPDPCNVDHKFPVWHDKWDDFSEQQSQVALTELQEFVGGQLKSALVKLKLQ